MPVTTRVKDEPGSRVYRPGETNRGGDPVLMFRLSRATLKRIIAAGVIAAGHAKERPSVEDVHARIFTEFAHRDVTCTEADLDKVKLYLAPVGKLVVVATGRPRILDLVDRYRDGERASLATDARPPCT